MLGPQLVSYFGEVVEHSGEPCQKKRITVGMALGIIAWPCFLVMLHFFLFMLHFLCTPCFLFMLHFLNVKASQPPALAITPSLLAVVCFPTMRDDMPLELLDKINHFPHSVVFV